MGVLYILDEPSIGLHQRDNERAHRHAASACATWATPWWWWSTTRTPSARADFVVDMGPGAGEHGGQVVAAGTPEEIVQAPKARSRPTTCRAAHASRCRRRAASPRRGSLKLTGRHREQPAERHAARCRFGTLTVVTGVSGSGKSSLVTDTLAPALANRLNHAHRRTGAYQQDHRARQARQGDQHRPEPHRAHAALQPGHLHRPVGRHPGAVRLHAGGQGARLRAGALLVQRERRPLRGVQGRRPDQDRDALPARHLRALRGVRRRTLQPRDAAGDVPRQEHRRRAGHDGGGGAGVLREHSRHQAQAADAARRGARLHPAWASPPPRFRAARRSA